MQITQKLDGTTLRLSLKGRLSTDTINELDEIVSNKLDNINKLILDFSNLEFISSAGLRIILKIKREHDDTKVVHVIDEVFDVFEMVGFNNFLTIEKKA